MKKYFIIFFLGLIAGGIDLIPLIMVNAPIINMVSIVCFWLVASLFIEKVDFFTNPFINGLVVSTLLMLPLVLTIYAINPKDFLPMLSMAIILGPFLGYFLKKWI